MILAILFLAPMARAEKIEYVTWLHGGGTATTNKVGVIPYWWAQFPDRDDVDGREIIFAAPFALINSWGAFKKAALKNAIEKLLSGRVKLSRANLPVWKTRLTDAGIPCEIVLPGQTPSFTAKVYVIVVARGKRGVTTLWGWGLRPEDTATPIP